MEHISAILANCWWMILLSALIAYLLGSINTVYFKATGKEV